MSSIPSAIGGAGVACASVSLALYSSNGTTTLVCVSGVTGAVLLFLGFAKRSIPRGMEDINLSNQTEFDEKSTEWVKETDEDGKPMNNYHGPKGKLGVKLSGEPVVEKGLIVSKYDSSLNGTYPKTMYDFVFGKTAFDDRPALARCIKQHTFADAMKDGKKNPKPMIIETPGEWEQITFKAVKLQARALGTCLRKEHKIEQKEKVAIWSGNSVEWMVTDLACAAYNWTSVSVYDTLGPDAASYIVGDSGAKVLVCEEKTFTKVPALLKDEIYTSNKGADLKIVVCTGKCDSETKKTLEEQSITVISFSEAVKAHSGALEPDTPPSREDIVTIMYTSGTTGMPKGVMLQHLNIVATIAMINLNPSIDLRQEDVHLSYLPLAHIFERQNCYGLLANGAVIYFASNGAKALLADLSIIKPTLFAGVPKVYENIRDAVKRKMTGFTKTLFDAAMKAKIADIETGCGYNLLWDLAVFKKTKQAMGGRVRFCVTGGAPISKDTLQFVLCAFGPIVQGYGATETSAASTLTMSFDSEIGHVGPPIGTAQIRLVDVPDMNYFSGSPAIYNSPNSDGKAKKAFDLGKNKNGGEVWIGGPGVSPGYYDPSRDGLKKDVPSNGMIKKTQEEFFKDDAGWSWFKTGDIGSWTKNGCLKIVDRKKNMFKTSLGEYVPVEEVEKVYQDKNPLADWVFLPKETKVSYIALCVVVSDSIGPVMKWAKENDVAGDEVSVVSSEKFKAYLLENFNKAAEEAKLQRFMFIPSIKNIYTEYQPPGYQEQWVTGVKCANGNTEQLLTATFKARRAQLDQYFAPAFPKIYPDRPSDHILP